MLKNIYKIGIHNSRLSNNIHVKQYLKTINNLLDLEFKTNVPRRVLSLSIYPYGGLYLNELSIFRYVLRDTEIFQINYRRMQLQGIRSEQ